MSELRVQSHWLGLTPYEKAVQLQERWAAEIAASTRPASLMLLEHPHTFTLGRRADQASLLWTTDELRRMGVGVYQADRGGEATYHGPGQLVGYPLLPLGPVSRQGRLPQADYVGYVRRLEETLIRALAGWGLASGQRPGFTGVWVQPDVASRCRHCPPSARLAPSKVAAIGVRIDRHGVSRHGFALNVDPDMAYWEGIIACGLVDQPVVSLAQLLESVPSMEQVRVAVLQAFAHVFGCVFLPG